MTVINYNCKKLNILGPVQVLSLQMSFVFREKPKDFEILTGFGAKLVGYGIKILAGKCCQKYH
jgi:hypothetical protein